MTYNDFDSSFRTLQVLESYILPVFFLWYYADAKSNKPSRLPPLIVSLYFIAVSLYAGVMCFFAQSGWTYNFKIWFGKVHAIHWRYDWYCGIVFAFYLTCGLWILHRALRKKEAGRSQNDDGGLKAF